MVSTRPLTSKSSSPFNKPFVTVPKAPIITGIIVLFIIIIIIHWEFFTSALADGLSLGFEWQQVPSSLQDSSQYSGWSQYYSSLDVLRSSSYFQVLQSFYQSFGGCTKSTNYDRCKR